MIKVNSDDSTVVTYHNANTNLLDIKDSVLAIYYRVVNFRKGEIKGSVITYFKNGQPYIIENYKGNDMKTASRNGSYTKYYASGKIYQIQNYKDNILDGNFTIYYPSGIRKASFTYLKGSQNGCAFQWDETGKLTAKAYLENGIPVSRNDCDTINIAHKTTSKNNNPITTFYEKDFSSGEYHAVNTAEIETQLSAFYKSNNAQLTWLIMRHTFAIGQDHQILSSDYSPTISVDGFKRVDGKYSYSTSVCVFFENGREFFKREGIENSDSNLGLEVELSYRKPSVNDIIPSNVLYVNFLIKDKFSDAVIQGYVIDKLKGKPIKL